MAQEARDARLSLRHGGLLGSHAGDAHKTDTAPGILPAVCGSGKGVPGQAGQAGQGLPGLGRHRCRGLPTPAAAVESLSAALPLRDRFPATGSAQEQVVRKRRSELLALGRTAGFSSGK